ncbi:MAG: hypothetical protein AAB354_10385, partial [candidate division KSB1 bacterium]
MNPRIISFLPLAFSLFINAAALAQTSSLTPEYQSYLAHVAAANASLRLNEAGEAKRWLAAAPMKPRNWEWRYLNARSDNSIAKIALDATADEAHFSADGKLLVAAMH